MQNTATKTNTTKITQCAYHHDREAVNTCPECNQHICSECYGIRGGKFQCYTCFAKQDPKSKSKASTSNKTVDVTEPKKNLKPKKLKGTLTKEPIANTNTAFTENTSGLGKNSPIPPGIKKWSWGAFLMGWIWGIGNKVWIALLVFIPLVNLVMPFILGAKGNEWAWQSKKWVSIEDFHMVQRLWMYWGIGLSCAAIIYYIVVLIVSLPRFL